MINHETYMQRCLQLARLAAGNVAPNPMVGSILVHNTTIIGEGFHKKYGYAHAEVNCINSVANEHRHLIAASTLYVSLEPCSHYGKTPPCTDLIIEKKIPKVIIGCIDIFKEVSGRGIKKLKDAGVEVITGILEKECVELNKRFFTFYKEQRPYIILKWAQSIDRKITGNDKRIYISNEYTNRLVHKWRSEEAAILIGTNTALHDDPLLTARLWKGKNPVRIVIDLNLRLPHSLKLFNKEATTIIFNTIKQEEIENLIFFKLNTENILQQIMPALYNMKIQSVIIEGGAKVLQSFIDAGLWDEARIIENENLVIYNGINAPVIKQFLIEEKQNYFSDTITIYKNS